MVWGFSWDGCNDWLCQDDGGIHSHKLICWSCYFFLPNHHPGIVTTQNDLVVASFASAGIYLFALGAYQKRIRLLILFAIAIGLGLGTKTTMFIALPGLAAGVVILALTFMRNNLKLLMIWLLSTGVAFTVLSSLVYIQNIRYYQNPLGESDVVSTISTGIATSGAERGVYNLLVYGYQSIDFSGLPQPIALEWTQVKASLFSKALSRFTSASSVFYSVNGYSNGIPIDFWHVSVSEDTSWFGIVAFILFLSL